MGPLDSCASCASGGAVRAISPDLGKSSISEMAQSHTCTHMRRRSSAPLGVTDGGAAACHPCHRKGALPAGSRAWRRRAERGASRSSANFEVGVRCSKPTGCAMKSPSCERSATLSGPTSNAVPMRCCFSGAVSSSMATRSSSSASERISCVAMRLNCFGVVGEHDAERLHARLRAVRPVEHQLGRHVLVPRCYLPVWRRALHHTLPLPHRGKCAAAHHTRRATPRQRAPQPRQRNNWTPRASHRAATPRTVHRCHHLPTSTHPSSHCGGVPARWWPPPPARAR